MDLEFDGLQISGSVQRNFKCTWTIEHFSSLDSRVGVSHKSKVFQLESDGTEVCLEIYPGGEHEDTRGYVSFFVNRVNNAETVKLNFNLSFRNKEDEILFDERNNEWSDFPHPGYGYPQTIRTRELTSQLVDDVLIVILEATYCATYVKDNFGTQRSAEIAPTNSFTENWRNLLTNKENADCVITVQGEDMPAHSLVLGTHSKVFAAMFKHDTKEKNSGRVRIEDFQKSTMIAFMEFIYSGNVSEMNYYLALELLRASDKYEVSHLKLYCSNYLMSLLDDANVCQVFVRADMFNADKLKSQALEYICENLSEGDVEEQRSVFDEKPDLLWSVVGLFFKKRRVWRDNGQLS